jgi:hypothetical protein
VHRLIKTIRPDGGSNSKTWDDFTTELKQSLHILFYTPGAMRITAVLVVLGACLGIIGSYEFIMLTEMNAPVRREVLR